MKLRTQKLELRRTLIVCSLFLSSRFSLLSSAQSGSGQEPEPILVDIVEPDSEITGLADVLIGALGLTGLLVLGAIVAAIGFAGVLFWIRRRFGTDAVESAPRITG